ncbi:sugar phosphate isomerase/epimerase [Aquiflexum sp. LQ15W]|uniref:sugar phosphate isomerase/epimerase family protein n=1 Tax=Cognataquiflexum nitidum TaxID=2922272 RepID=UPI001F13F135|nr:sugar phosphate isomerase/epimerase family protein [Cognataquiflexum nitidum]MCH6200998.1 sugar phosphate isomerase/epimerase [Cognataquiflexum nitidum]
MIPKISYFKLKTFGIVLIALVINSVFVFDSFSQTTPFPKIGACAGYKDGEVLAKAGFSFIEENVQSFLVPTKSEEEFDLILQASKSSPLPIEAFIIFLLGSLKSVGPNAVHGDILDYAEVVFRRANKAGGKLVVFGSSGSRSVPDGFSKEEATKQMIALGKLLGPIAAKYDITVVLESLNTKECNFINSLSEAGEIVKAVNHPNYRLLADIYHMKMEGEGPESILNYGHLIKHVHVAEKEGRAVPGTHGEDLSLYYQALKLSGYEGSVSLESRWENMGNQAAKAIETIKKQW